MSSSSGHGGRTRISKDLEDARKKSSDPVVAAPASTSKLKWHQLLNPRRAVDHHRNVWAGMDRTERMRLVALYAGVISLLTWITGVIIMLVDTHETKSEESEAALGTDRYEQLLRSRGENPTQTRIFTALLGMYLGPLLLFYGYQIPQLIIVLTALISSGIAKYAEEIEHMEQLNAQAAAGRILPKQVADLAKLMLSTFTIASAEMKIPAFDALMKGAVCANILMESIVNMIPKGKGCMCGELANIDCSPVFNAGQYMVELRCYDDRWRRFLVRWVFVGSIAVMAMYKRELTFKLNPAVLGANLMCQAIFDTVLAVLPEYGERVQPYRFVGLLLFTVISTRLHYWMQQFDRQCAGEVTDEAFDRELTAIPLLKPLLQLLHRVGLCFMMPLRMLDDICDGLRTIGQQDLIVEELEKRAFVEEMKSNPEVMKVDSQTIDNMRELSNDLVKLSAKVDVIDNHDGWMRHLCRFINVFLFLFGVWLLAATIHLDRYTEWGHILPKRVLAASIAASVIIIVVSLLGLRGVQSKNRASLCWYGLLVILTFAVTAVGAIFAFATSDSVYPLGLDMSGASNTTVRYIDARIDDVTSFVHDDFLVTYRNAGCKVPTAGAASSSWLEGSMAATECSTSGTAGLQSAIRTRCAYYNRTDADELASREDRAYEASDWETYLKLGKQKRGVLRQSHSIESCFDKYGLAWNATKRAAEGGQVTYCLCRSALAETMYDYTRAIGAVAFAAMVVQFLLLGCTFTMLSRQNEKRLLLAKTMKVRRQLAALEGSEAAKTAVLQTMENITGVEVHAAAEAGNEGKEGLAATAADPPAAASGKLQGKLAQARVPKRQVV